MARECLKDTLRNIGGYLDHEEHLAHLNIVSKISFFFCVHSCNTIIVGEIGKLDLDVPVKFSSILPAGNLMAENSFLLSPISGI